MGGGLGHPREIRLVEENTTFSGDTTFGPYEFRQGASAAIIYKTPADCPAALSFNIKYGALNLSNVLIGSTEVLAIVVDEQKTLALEMSAISCAAFHVVVPDTAKLDFLEIFIF